ncbi:MAG: MBL fold metallo-hydrolase [Clostridiales bacterium]|nr:MBL fold metallo-hydrolase [Clostridiales bacterium]
MSDELIRAGEKTWYTGGTSKTGFYLTDKRRVVIIDTGLGDPSGEGISEILTARGWTPEAIFNTHSHADHIAGNAALQKKYGCPAYAMPVSAFFIRETRMNATAIFGGLPTPEMEHPFFLAAPSDCRVLTDSVMPQGMSFFSLPGHSYDMAGFACDDGTVFLADALVEDKDLKNNPIAYIFDPGATLETLRCLSEQKLPLTGAPLPGVRFVSSHCETFDADGVAALSRKNIDHLLQITALLKEFSREPIGQDDLVRRVFDHFGIRMTVNRFMLACSGTRNIMAWLRRRGEADIDLSENTFKWVSK